ncbi:hypothetical protein M758_8G030900 [Ceratodon purpureus]|nr:hypothetical protein M758_8G030900 [Ceratodon purpureus]
MDARNSKSSKASPGKHRDDKVLGTRDAQARPGRRLGSAHTEGRPPEPTKHPALTAEIVSVSLSQPKDFAKGTALHCDRTPTPTALSCMNLLSPPPYIPPLPPHFFILKFDRTFHHSSGYTLLSGLIPGFLKVRNHG